MCVIHTIPAGECNVSFKFLGFIFYFLVIILLFSWKLHTGINRANRSIPSHRPGHRDEDMEEILLCVEGLR